MRFETNLYGALSFSLCPCFNALLSIYNISVNQLLSSHICWALALFIYSTCEPCLGCLFNTFLPSVSLYLLPLFRVTFWFRRVALDHLLHFLTPLFVCLCICELTGGGREAWRAKTGGGAWGGEHHWVDKMVGRVKKKREGGGVFAVTWCLFSWCI